jgi:hypothetical protein
MKEDGNGRNFVLSFQPNGEVIESDASKMEITWRGTWKVSDGVLRLYIGGYTTDYLAGEDGRVLTGVEQHVRAAGFAYFTIKPLGAWWASPRQRPKRRYPECGNFFRPVVEFHGSSTKRPTLR